MFKYLLVAVLAGSLMTGCATNLDPSQTNPTQVVDVKGHQKAEVFRLANKFIAENYGSYKAVVDYKDEQEGTMIGHIIFPCGTDSVSVMRGMMIQAKLKIDTKDEKFKLSFSDLQNYDPVIGPRGIMLLQHDWDASSAYLQDMAAKMQTYIMSNNSAAQGW